MVCAGYIRRVAASITLIALFLGAVLRVLNPWLTPRDVIAIAADLWVALGVLIGAPAVLVGLVQFRVRQTRGSTSAFAVVAGVVFILVWFARLEPAHQVVSIRPHLSWIGLAELALITGLGVVLMAMGRPHTTQTPRGPFRFVLWAAAACGLVATVAFAVEPRRDRRDAIDHLRHRFRAADGSAAAGPRLLVLGIDGLEWRAVDRLIAAGRLPVLARLMQNGSFYEHDNHALTFSPEIWTAMYTGRGERENRVGGYSSWGFLGAPHRVAFLPRFGIHAWMFLDEFMRRTEGVLLWADYPVSTLDMLTPPVWSIASANGKRVGVVEPVPLVAIPERLNGFYAVRDDRRFQVTGSDPTGSDDFFQETSGQPPGGDPFAQEESGASAAARIFERHRVDLGMYYTHFLDAAQHRFWDFRFRGRFFGGDPHPLDAAFDRSEIAAAYEACDRMIGSLTAGFGRDSTVVVVSDHGWRYDDYEHFRSPYGVLIVSPAPHVGYGGVADVLSITPTLLSLLNVPIDAAMRDPLPSYPAQRIAGEYGARVHREFAVRSVGDAERLRVLRSLGYVEGRAERPKVEGSK